MNIRLLAALAALLLSPLAARAQVIPVPQVVAVGPTDLIQVIPNGAPTAPSVYATAAQITNVPGYVKSVPLTGFSLSFTNGQTWWLINPAGTLATGTFNFSPSPRQGTRNCIRSTQTQTAVTLAAAVGTIDAPITAMTANTTYCYMYDAVSNAWDLF